MEESSDDDVSYDGDDNVNYSAKKKKKHASKKSIKKNESVDSSSKHTIKTIFSGKKLRGDNDDQDRRSMKSSTESVRGVKKHKKTKKARFQGEAQVEAVDKSGDVEGLAPVFLTLKTQERFGLLIDEDVTAQDAQRYIPKAEIMADLEENPETSDFNSVKDFLMDYKENDVLIVYDADFQMGQNFYLAFTEHARIRIAKSVMEVPNEETDEGMLISYKPPIPMPWTSLGSEFEIQDWTIEETRDKIKISLTRNATFFNSATNFTDVTAAENARSVVDIQATVDDKLYSDVKRMELDVGVQAVPVLKSTGVQKVQGSSKNQVVQCTPRVMPQEEADALMEGEGVALFLSNVLPLMDKSLQQNQILDVFSDDWGGLNQAGEAITAKSDNHLKEFQSYTEMQHGKAYAVSYIEWHPWLPELVAVALIENLSYYELMDQTKKQNPQPSLILFWHFLDPIHPLLKLEAPNQITCFQFCPTNPYFIAAGCFSGQLVMWDLSCFKARLKNGSVERKKNKLNLAQDLDTSLLLQVGRFCAVSSIDNSHKAPVNQVIWLPHQYEITKFGALMTTKYEQAFQLISCSADQSLMFWDIRTIKGTIPGDQRKEVVLKDMCFSPSTFRHLDLVWKPFLRLMTIKDEMGIDYSPIKFLTHAYKENEVFTEENKPSLMFLGTEDGDLLYTNWCPMKDQETGKYQAQRPVFSFNVHNGPIVCLDRHPSYSDILLSVGGWNFAIWREGFHQGPIFQSGFCSKHYTGGCWSKTRAAIFFLIKVDGSLDVWNLLDRTHEAIHTQVISTSQISTIVPIYIPKNCNYIAIGSTNGSLHLLEPPPSLSIPIANEATNMRSYLSLEEKRVVYLLNRRNKRREENLAKNSIPKKVKTSAFRVEGKKKEEVEEEAEETNAMLYESFLKLEASFKEMFGLA